MQYFVRSLYRLTTFETGHLPLFLLSARACLKIRKSLKMKIPMTQYECCLLLAVLYRQESP